MWFSTIMNAEVYEGGGASKLEISEHTLSRWQKAMILKAVVWVIMFMMNQKK